MHISSNLNLHNQDQQLPQPVKPNYKPIINVTKPEDLKNHFNKLKIIAGDILFVHASISSLNYLPGGARTLLESLIESVGPSGTLVFPAFTGDNSDPMRWRAPPASSHGVRREILEATPAFDPILSTPWKRVGQLPALATIWPNAVRSMHPQLSFVAIGTKAQQICGNLEDAMDFPLSDSGVMGRLRKLPTKVLFIGTTWNTCTGLHLLEHDLFTPVPEHMQFNETSVIKQNNRRCYVNFKMFIQSTTDFNSIGASLEKNKPDLFSKTTLNSCNMLCFPFAQTLEAARPLMRSSRGI